MQRRRFVGEEVGALHRRVGDAELGDGLDGFEFLIMAEAGELGHWEILKTLNDQAGIGVVRELTDFAIPVQQRHEKLTRETALALAASEDPLEAT